ncbi:MAG: DUF5312 family protein [Spirochaetaceae bacterium]
MATRPSKTTDAGGDQASDTSDNLIERLLSIVFGGNNPERQKKRQLKQIAKDVSRSKYKFYRARGDLAQPGLATFFFDVYSVIGPARNLLQNARESQGLRDLVVEHFFTEQQRTYLEALSEDSIRALAEKEDSKTAVSKVKAAMQHFYASFDSQSIQRTNRTYTLLRQFLDLVMFDYFFVLRKFDATIGEERADAQPKFEAINASYISDDIKDFLEVFLSLELEADWSDVLDILKEYRAVEIVDRKDWKKLVNYLAGVRKSDVLVQIVRLADADPYYEPTITVGKHRILEPYLEKLKVQSEAYLQKVAIEKRNRKVERLCQEVFGKTAISRAKFYTDKANVTLGPRVGTGYMYLDSFNYLKAFLIDYFKKDVRQLQDLLVIRGKWTEPLTSQQLSDSFHTLMDIATKVVEFDDSLSEEGERGMKLKKAIGRSSERDKASQKVVAGLVEETNAYAKRLINESGQLLISIGKVLRLVIEDRKKKKPELLLNWKEVETYSEESIDERMAEVYRTIYFFIQLLQLSMKR